MVPALPPISPSMQPATKNRAENRHAKIIREKVRAKAMKVAFIDKLRNKMLCENPTRKTPEIIIKSDSTVSVKGCNDETESLDDVIDDCTDSGWPATSSLTSSQAAIQGVKKANLSEDMLRDITLQDSPSRVCCYASSAEQVKVAQVINKPQQKLIQITIESSQQTCSKPVVAHPTKINKISPNRDYVYGKFAKSKYSSFIRQVTIKQHPKIKKEVLFDDTSALDSESDISGLGYQASVLTTDLESIISIPPFVIREEVLQRIHFEKKRNRYYALQGWYSVSSMEERKKVLVSHGTDTEEGRVLIGSPWSGMLPAINAKSGTGSFEKSIRFHSSCSSTTLSNYLSFETPLENKPDDRSLETLWKVNIDEQPHNSQDLKPLIVKSEGQIVTSSRSPTNYVDREKRVKERATNAARKWLKSYGLIRKKGVTKFDKYRYPLPTKKYTYYKQPRVRRPVKHSPNACIHGLSYCICKTKNWLAGKSFGKKLKSSFENSIDDHGRQDIMFSHLKRTEKHRNERFEARRPLLCTQRHWLTLKKRGI